MQWPRASVCDVSISYAGNRNHCYATSGLWAGRANSTPVYRILGGKGLTPFPCRAMASTRGLAMAEPSAGRVAVEVIATLNHFTQLATGTTSTGGMLGVDVRSRVAIVFMLEADAVAPRPSRHSA